MVPFGVERGLPGSAVSSIMAIIFFAIANANIRISDPLARPLS